MYLYGKNSIIERLTARPKSIKKIYAQTNFKDENLLNIVASCNIPLTRLSEKELMRMKRADRLQGIIAEVKDFIYTPYEELLHESKEKDATLIMLDNINDPHNLGSIIRIAACFGKFAIVIPKHDSCSVNETVIHVASGGESYVPVSRVTNMTNAIIKAKNAGFWVVGTVVEDGSDINDMELPFPLCLVLGSEGKGIRPGVLKHLDLKTSLPMKGASLSFNVSMACAIFCHEISRQIKSKKKG